MKLDEAGTGRTITGLTGRTSLPRSRIRSVRAKPRRSERERDPVYLASVRMLACYAADTVPGHVCAGTIEADHAGQRPLGRKCHDSETIPLCQRAHRERTDMAGPWRSWDRARMRAWLDLGIERTQLALGRRTGMPRWF